jgi:Aspartyl protease
MTRPTASLGFILVLAVFAAAQNRSGSEDERDNRLATYLRTGRYADARRLIDEMLKTEPREDLKNVREVFGSGPNMRVRHSASSFTCEVTETGVRLPLSVNGRRLNWLLDTGANVTMISDAEAARFGLVIRDSKGRAADLAGGTTSVRTAIAPRLVVGRTQFENVPFLLTPANQMPWKELPPGRQGILGLPLAIALDALRWTRAGVCHTGSTARDGSSLPTSPNLRYEGLHVVTMVDVDGKVLEFLFDTGNQAGTQLWERFGKDFEALVKERGRKGSARVTQIGGATDRDIIVIPGMHLKVGGKDTTLPEGKLFSRPVGDDRFHGLLGMDVLTQAAEVTIDFRSMTLTLR